jgi:hypothetical protein
MIGTINLWNRFGVGFRLVPSARLAKASAAECGVMEATLSATVRDAT